MGAVAHHGAHQQPSGCVAQSRRVSRQLPESVEQRWYESLTVTLHTTKSLRNAEVIDSMSMLDTLRGRWAVRQRRVLVLQSGTSHKSDVITSISKTLRAWAQSMILAAGAYLVITHEINPGLMMAGSILLGRARAPIDQMIGSWKGLVAACVQYQRLNETLDKQRRARAHVIARPGRARAG